MTTEGKTKIIVPFRYNEKIARIISKGNITAGNGKRHDKSSEKAELATRTTCNIFDFLANKNISMAYIGRYNQTTFLARHCQMIPIEVVVRWVATGSYLKRNTDSRDGDRFSAPIVEFYHKTSNEKFGERSIGCDDPLITVTDKGFELHKPDQPICYKSYVAHSSNVYSEEKVQVIKEQLKTLSKLALEISVHIASAWRCVGGDLWDIKLEFGFSPEGEILLADVIDCDSWRVLWEGLRLSKQGYREGDNLEEVLEIYSIAASLTERFSRL